MLQVVGHRRKLARLLQRLLGRLVVRVRVMCRRLRGWRLVLLWKRVVGQLVTLGQKQVVLHSKQVHRKIPQLRLRVRLPGLL